MPIPDAAARRFPVWNPSSSLSDRVKRLRDEYFSFDTRSFRNEVMPFSTGTAWDTVFMASRWTIVPEVLAFVTAYADSLLAAATVVPLPVDFWRNPLPIRVATFFREVLARHLPVHILEGELIKKLSINSNLAANSHKVKNIIKTAILTACMNIVFCLLFLTKSKCSLEKSVLFFFIVKFPPKSFKPL